MPIQFVNELPDGPQPRHRAGRSEVEATLGQLYSQPQVWAKLEDNAPKSRLVTWRARADRLSDGIYEFVGRPNGQGNDDAVAIYGRYTGHDKDPVTPTDI